MHIKKTDAKSRKGGNIEIFNYITKDLNLPFSVAKAKLEGKHGPTINSVSDRCYIIIDGEGEAMVDKNIYQIKESDVIYIKKGLMHSISGNVIYFVINSPAFNPKTESRP